MYYAQSKRGDKDHYLITEMVSTTSMPFKKLIAEWLKSAFYYATCRSLVGLFLSELEKT